MSNWYCIRTATRQEHKVVDGLRELAQERAIELDAYLPCETRWSRSGRVRTRRQTPLMPGYLFLAIGPEHLWRVAEIVGVYQILRTAEGPLSAADTDKLAMLRLAEVNREFDFTKEADPGRMKKGAIARVTGGQAGGFIGQIMDTPRNKRVTLLLSLFGNPWKLSISVSQLEIIQDAEGEKAA